MSVEDIYGNVVIRSRIERAARTVSQLARQSIDGSHVIEVENWATIPYDVEIHVDLPQNINRLWFVVASTKSNTWTASTWSLAQNDIQDQSCPVTCGNNAGAQRIHCSSVRWKKAGSRIWKRPQSGAIPLSLQISVV
jgi:hypothetical protein